MTGGYHKQGACMGWLCEVCVHRHSLDEHQLTASNNTATDSNISTPLPPRAGSTESLPLGEERVRCRNWLYPATISAFSSLLCFDSSGMVTSGPKPASIITERSCYTDSVQCAAVVLLKQSDWSKNSMYNSTASRCVVHLCYVGVSDHWLVIPMMDH